jgi:hypothetical protein
MLRSAPPQPGQLHGAGCRWSSLGRCSGKGHRAGFCASAAVSTAAATAGDAIISRSAWSVSSASSASSSCSASRASFSEDRPNSARRYRANWNFSRAISAWAVSASYAIAAMIRFSVVRSSGRLSAVIGTPAVDQACRRFGQWLREAAAAGTGQLSRPALAARFAAAFASRSPPTASTIAPGSARLPPPRPAARRIARAPAA